MRTAAIALTSLALTSVALASLAMPTPPATSAQARDNASAAAKYQPLHGSQCLDPTRARGWTHLDDSHILIDAGRDKYWVEFYGTCPGLGFTSNILFRGDPISGRVCGSFTDSVLTHEQPCRIGRMELLSKQQYRRALDDYNANRKARKAERAAKKSKPA